MDDVKGLTCTNIFGYIWQFTFSTDLFCFPCHIKDNYWLNVYISFSSL